MISVLALGACSGDDPEPKVADPSPSATLPSSPSTTPVSGPVEPTMPAEARGTDAAAAEAFVKFYWEMVNYAQATGDVEGVRDLAPQCGTCDAAINYIVDVYDRGGRIEGGEGRFRHLRANFLDHEGGVRALVRGDLASAEQRVDLPGSRNDQSFPGGTLPFELLLEAGADGWTVLTMGQQ
ncbi:DUF6318 family protein [Nocardioides sp.]|uniref:DUF6318 family protein n=1 Tax=Nocardioides sp. TaxID=35761 RepID=UPI0025F9BEB3|nr:DUF6318 family protein [Nocardioides sp.]